MIKRTFPNNNQNELLNTVYDIVNIKEKVGLAPA